MKHLLMEAKNEIVSLRRQNELLAAQVRVVNIFEAALFGPRPQQGMSPDVVWAIEKKLVELDKQPTQP